MLIAGLDPNEVERVTKQQGEKRSGFAQRLFELSKISSTAS